MATNLRSTIHAELGWNWQDQAGSGVVAHSSRLHAIATLDNGAGVGQADAVWDAAGVALAAGMSITFELDSLERPIFGDTIYLSMLKIKALLIANRNADGDAYLLVGGAASDPWYAPLGTSGDTIKVMPGGAVLLSCPRDGWDVETSAKCLKIAAVGAGVTFDIAVLGTITADSSSSSSSSL